MNFYKFMDKADLKVEKIKEQIGGNLYDDISGLFSKIKFNFDNYTIICVAILVLFLMLGIIIVDPKCFRRWKRNIKNAQKTKNP